jgi:hypothetical protein
MTESSKTTNETTPKKRIEMPSSFKDMTKPGAMDIFIGAGGMKRKPDEAAAKP